MKGEVVYLFAFDVANEIATHEVREICSRPSFPYEVRVDHTFPKDVPIHKPLAIEPLRRSQLLGRPLEVLIRVYDVGVVNVAARAPFEIETLAELHAFHDPRTEDGAPVAELAARLCAEVCESLRGSMVRASRPSDPEAYTVFCLTDLGPEHDANAWLRRERRAVGGLLAESDPAALSEEQIDEVLRIRRSFFDRDLVVVDWDAALVVDLDGYADDVLYVLELANLQLEELRVMDLRLDWALDRAYKDLDRRHGLLGRRSGMPQWLRRFRVDVTKLGDEVTNITKFFGDWHLARIYLGAQERFHLQEWRQSVEARLGQLDQLYSVLQADVYERRMLWLEVAIVVLFVADLVAIVVWTG